MISNKKINNTTFKHGEHGERKLRFLFKILKQNINTHSTNTEDWLFNAPSSFGDACAGLAMRAKWGGLCGESHGLDFLVTFLSRKK